MKITNLHFPLINPPIVQLKDPVLSQELIIQLLFLLKKF